MARSVILAAVRTPFGKIGGALAEPGPVGEVRQLLADLAHQREGTEHARVPACARAHEDQAVDARLQRLLGVAHDDDDRGRLLRAGGGERGEREGGGEILQALLDVEASGEAARIFETWFGPGTEMPMKRTFKIQPD